MKISFSKDFGTITFVIDEENYEQEMLNCSRIEKMIKSEEYQLLLGLYLQIKEKYDEAVMKVKPTEQSFRETAIYSARLNGFWEAVKAPQKVVDAYNNFKKERKEEIAAQIDEVLGAEELTIANE